MSDETVVYRGSPSLLHRTGPLVIGSLVVLGAVWGAVQLWNTTSVFWWLLPAAALASASYMAYEILVLKAIQYEVTTQRIRVRQGILTKRTDELELYRANDTALIEPLWYRFFGLGTVEVETMEAGAPCVFLEAIHDAGQVREQLRMHIEACRDRKRVQMMEFDELSTAGKTHRPPR